MTLAVNKYSAGISVECSSTVFCLMFFSRLEWGEKPGRLSAFASDHLKGRCCQHDLSLVMLTLVIQLFCLGDRSLLAHLLSYLFMYLLIYVCIYHLSTPVWTHAYLFYTLGYKPVLLFKILLFKLKQFWPMGA